MKRREFKKTINFLCGELFAECVALLHYQKPASKEDVENVMKNILMLQNDMICRLSHVEPGSQKLFFSKMKEELITRTDEIVEQIKSLA